MGGVPLPALNPLFQSRDAADVLAASTQPWLVFCVGAWGWGVCCVAPTQRGVLQLAGAATARRWSPPFSESCGGCRSCRSSCAMVQETRGQQDQAVQRGAHRMRCALRPLLCERLGSATLQDESVLCTTLGVRVSGRPPCSLLPERRRRRCRRSRISSWHKVGGRSSTRRRTAARRLWPRLLRSRPPSSPRRLRACLCRGRGRGCPGWR